MRRALMLMVCTVLLVGCSQSQTPSSETSSTSGMATISLADLEGTWDGGITVAGNDTVLADIELNATPDPTGWTMRVTNAKDPAIMRLVSATSVTAQGDSVIVDAGPFESVLRAGQQVTTHSVYRLENGNLVGMHMTTYPASGETIMLHSVAMRRSM